MWGDVLCRRSGGQKSPSGVQEQSPGRGSGGQSPPEAEAILDFYMHNFDRILNYFCFARATEIRVTLWIREKYWENVKIWGDIVHWRPPTPNSGGTCPPSSKVYTSVNSSRGRWDNSASNVAYTALDISPYLQPRAALFVVSATDESIKYKSSSATTNLVPVGHHFLPWNWTSLLLLLLLLSAVTHAPFHASVLRPTSWPNARDRRDGEVN